MLVKQMLRLTALGLFVLFFGAGCIDGVLFEKQRGDGGVQRLRLDSGEGWDTYDTTPRYRSQRNLDDYSIMLKNEATF